MSKPIKHLANRFYEFGEFRVDTQNSLLLRDGEVVPLKPRVFDTLLALIECPGVVLSKDELINQVWTDSFVEESNLTHNISVLRKVLGDEAGGESYIETIPKRGYRFVGDVREVVTKEVSPVVEIRPPVPLTLVEEKSNTLLPVQPPKPRTGWQPRRRVLLVGVLLLAVTAVLAYWWIKSKSAPPVSPAPIKSIAVLPFKPLDAGQRDEAQELGMAISLITKLSDIREIIVRPVGLVRKYTALNQDPLAAGRELQVDAVLEASYQQDGEKTRAYWRLYRVSDGTTILAESCDQSCRTIFELQDAVAQQIASKLALRLTGEEKQQLAKHYTENTDAFRLYSTGLYYLSMRTRVGVEKSLTFFDEAVKRDPNYALPYTALARAYRNLAANFFTPQEARQKEAAAVQKALELDDTLAEAHAALSQLKQDDWDWAAGEKEALRALELNPNTVVSHFCYANYLFNMGRLDEYLLQIKKAYEIDPLSLLMNEILGLAFYNTRQYDAAIEQERKTLAMDPNWGAAHNNLAKAYMMKGRYEEAIAEFQTAIPLIDPSGSSRQFAFLAYTYAVSGRREEAQKMLKELQERARHQYVSPDFFALIYTGLGDKDQAFAWLQKSCEEHINPWLGPHYDSLRSDPRFTELLRRMNLAQ